MSYAFTKPIDRIRTVFNRDFGMFDCVFGSNQTETSSIG